MHWLGATLSPCVAGSPWQYECWLSRCVAPVHSFCLSMLQRAWCSIHDCSLDNKNRQQRSNSYTQTMYSADKWSFQKRTSKEHTISAASGDVLYSSSQNLIHGIWLGKGCGNQVSAASHSPCCDPPPYQITYLSSSDVLVLWKVHATPRAVVVTEANWYVRCFVNVRVVLHVATIKPKLPKRKPLMMRKVTIHQFCMVFDKFK